MTAVLVVRLVLYAKSEKKKAKRLRTYMRRNDLVLFFYLEHPRRFYGENCVHATAGNYSLACLLPFASSASFANNLSRTFLR
jgi:hypothetical protein